MFCEKCGKKVSVNNTDLPQKGQNLAAAERSGDKQNDDIGKLETSVEMVSAEHGNQRKRTPAQVIAVLIIGAAVLAIAGGLFLRGRSGNAIHQETAVTDVLSQNNFNNGGVFAYDKEKLYFCAPYEEGSDEYSLYSTDLDGDNKQLISSNDKIRRFRITENKLLYTAEYEDGRYTLEMMDPDGKNVTTIVKDNPGISMFDMAGEDIYYTSEKELHVCSVKGANDRVILRDVNAFVCINDVIYYTTDKGACSYNRKTEDDTMLIDGNIRELCYEDGKLYYIKDNAVYRMDLDEKEEKKLADVENARSMLVLEDQIAMLHPMTYDELVEVFGESAKEKVLVTAGGGYLISVPKDGGPIDKVEKVYIGVELFGCKDDMYVIMSYFSNELFSIRSMLTK